MITRENVKRAGISAKCSFRAMNGRGYVARIERKRSIKQWRNWQAEPRSPDNSLKNRQTYLVVIFRFGYLQFLLYKLFNKMSDYAMDRRRTLFYFLISVERVENHADGWNDCGERQCGGGGAGTIGRTVLYADCHCLLQSPG